jgi:hypothetical protein
MHSQNQSFLWHFPLPRPHTGIALSNGHQGVLIWGDNTLCLTVARAGFWDRRAGKPFGSKTNFGEVRALLEANDEAALRTLFAEVKEEGFPSRPQQIGGGRLEISFPDGLVPVRGELFYEDARVEITLENASGQTRVLTISQNTHQELTRLTGDWEGAEIRLRPTWEWVGDKLKSWGYDAPQEWGTEDSGGFVQEHPESDSLALAWRKDEGELLISTALAGDAPPRARRRKYLGSGPAPDDRASGTATGATCRAFRCPTRAAEVLGAGFV